MRLFRTARRPGDLAIGALLLGPLSTLPLAVWVVESGVYSPGVCGLKQLFGVPCLTCGATRATVHLFHGRLFEALKFQPLIIFLYLGLTIWALVSAWALFRQVSLRLELTEREDLLLKIAVGGLPVLNWAYLWAAGI